MSLMLLNNFTDERIEIKMIKSMFSSELSRFWVDNYSRIDLGYEKKLGRYWINAHIFAANIIS